MAAQILKSLYALILATLHNVTAPSLKRLYLQLVCLLHQVLCCQEYTKIVQYIFDSPVCHSSVTLIVPLT